MSFMKYRVKFLEYFKDGNILEGRAFQSGQEAVLDESDVHKIAQSGGLLEKLETLIPRPVKEPEKVEAPVEAAPVKEPKAKKHAQ
jgi:hypothetical protein